MRSGMRFTGCTPLIPLPINGNMLRHMAIPTSPLKRCPDLLVPVIANILASRPVVDQASGHLPSRRVSLQGHIAQGGVYRQEVTLSRQEYDELMMLFNRTMGQAFLVPIQSSQRVCAARFATSPLLAKQGVFISLYKLPATGTKLWDNS